MTRKWFLGLIGLGAAGQSAISTPANQNQGMWTDGLIPGEHRKPKPRNGECPVCGTMAKPYRPEKAPKFARDCANAYVTGRKISSECKEAILAAPLPCEEVRCAHCSAAFWQDAEYAK